MKLHNGHIIIPVALVKTVLENDTQVNWVYYPERHTLLIAGRSKIFFEKMHKTHWQTLKDKNTQGDKALLVRAILLDNDLDDTDRDLVFDLKNTGIIAINL
jgi:hypothetical protein